MFTPPMASFTTPASETSPDEALHDGGQLLLIRLLPHERLDGVPAEEELPHEDAADASGGADDEDGREPRVGGLVLPEGGAGEKIGVVDGVVFRLVQRRRARELREAGEGLEEAVRSLARSAAQV